MATQKKASAKKDAVKQIENAVNAQKDTVETMVKAGTEAATKNVENAVKMTQEQVEKANVKAFKTIDDLYSFNKDNMDAVVKAGSIYLKGVEAINKQIFSFAQKSLENSFANAKAVMTAKSIKEVVELNNDFTKKAFDEVVSETTKLSELSTQVANDAAKPISDRVQLTVEQFNQKAA